eukprot:gene12198-5785_t
MLFVVGNIVFFYINFVYEHPLEKQLYEIMEDDIYRNKLLSYRKTLIDNEINSRNVKINRTDNNPVLIYSASGPAFWPHLNLFSPEWTEDCPVPCKFSEKFEDFEKSDIVWSHELTNVAVLLNRMPLQKPKKIAVLTLENFYRSATMDNMIRRFYVNMKRNFRHWMSKVDILISMSKHSDVVVNYFYGLGFKEKYSHTPEIVQKYLIEKPITKKKRKDVLASTWISNCFSVVRNTYIKELSKHMKIDHYGKCFNSGLDGKKYNKEEQQSSYKFILAFENTVQSDYLSEKYFGALRADAVLVYFGAPNMHDYSPISGKMGINALDYTPEELAKFLQELADDDEKYNQYLNWKKQALQQKFLQDSRKDFLLKGKDGWMCRLCQHYHQRYD